MKPSQIVDLSHEDNRNRPSVPHPATPSGVSRRDFTSRFLFHSYFPVDVDLCARLKLVCVFEFLPVACLETVVARVSRAWLRMTREEDVWRRRWTGQGMRPESYRAWFVDAKMGECWNCAAYVDHFGVESEELGRLLCEHCARQSCCRPTSLKVLTRQFSLQKSTVDLLHIPVFTQHAELCTYPALLTRKLLPYCERRRELLLDRLKGALAKTVRQKIKEVDFNKALEGAAGVNKYSAALMEFCGRNERSEDLRHACL